MKLAADPKPTGPPLRDARLTAINFVADAVNRTLDLREVADNALAAVLAAMKLDAGAVYIWQDAEAQLRLFAWRGLPEAFVRQLSQIRRGEEQLIDEVLGGATRVIEDFRIARRPPAAGARGAGFKAGLMAPIRAQGFVVGLIALGCYRQRRFYEDDTELIEVITNQIGNAMVNAQLQADLRASEEQHRALVENSDNAIFITDVRGRPRFANAAFTRIFGFTLAEASARELFDAVHPEDIDAVRQGLEQLRHGAPVQNLEFRFRRADGEWIHLQCAANVFAGDQGRVRELQFVVREVTEARRRQQQLLRRNRQLAALTMMAGVINSSLNVDEIARSTLEVALASTGMEAGVIHLADAERQQLQLFLQVGVPGELAQPMQRLAWGEGVVGEVAASGEANVYTMLGNEAPLERVAAEQGFRALIVVPVKKKGEMLGTLALLARREVPFTPEIVEMITAMGNQLGIAVDNAQLLKRLQEKNELLRLLIEEAHHRIKNNLQMVSGLLQLQAETGREEIAVPLRDAMARIHAIAKVHNQLSQEQPGHVDMVSLIRAISDTLVARSPAGNAVAELDLQLDPLWLRSEQAVAVALVVNELVANSLKHGRPGGREPLRVRLECRREAAAARLLVTDNGGGLPVGYDPRQSSGQGMQIIQQLVAVNLRGRFNLNNTSDGTEARVEFEIAAQDVPPAKAVVAAPGRA